MSRAREVGDLGSVATVDSSGNVGIGTSSPNNYSANHRSITLNAPTTPLIDLEVNGTRTGSFVADSTKVDLNAVTSVPIRFLTADTERARLDSSGNLLVGKTSLDFGATAGQEFRADGRVFIGHSGAGHFVNRIGSDGAIAGFRKDGSTVGSISSLGSERIAIHSGTVGIEFNPSNQVNPSSGSAPLDNVLDLGASGTRWDDIYATNGTIQTSDRNEKQDIEALSDAEQGVAVAAKGLLRKYRWKSAVAEKGDEARIHFGIIAQDLQAAFEAEGLDAGRYGMFISSTWWEAERVIPAVEGKDAVLDDEGNVVEEAVEAQPERVVTDTFNTLEEAPEGAVQRTRLGVRYPELLAFIIAAL